MADILEGIHRPSSKERDSHFKPGSIKRVKLKNFLTYDEVEFFPGPRLNVVVGPNGTGKSTIICAICLGLGGQPPLLGRADDARLFIKHEKEQAVIEIELAPYRGSPTHIFKRIIDRNRGSENGKGAAASTYFINGHKSNVKGVKELVMDTYKISIDNLCTFLPQDKVGNFSGFDKQALLLETEKSLSDFLYKSHQDLILLETEVRSSGNDVHSIEATLQDLIKQNEKLERDKKLMEERESMKVRIDLLKRKRAWLVFDEKRAEAKDLKDRREDLKKLKKEAERSMKPLTEKHAQVEGEVSRIRSRFAALDRKCKDDRKAFEDCMSKSQNFLEGVDEETINLTNFDAQQRRAEREVEKHRLRLVEIEAEQNEFPPMDEVEKAIADAQQGMRLAKKDIDDVRRKLRVLQERLEEEESKKSDATQRLEKMMDEKKIRLNRLFSLAKNLKDSFEWVDQNRKMFRKPVWGPVGAEVQPTNQDTAAYLENHVSNATWRSYIVECKEDYNLLYREIREKRGIPINIIVVPNGKLEANVRMYSDERMSVLQREHGFHCFLDETFIAPEAICAALQTRHNVDKVLVGGEQVQHSLERKDLIEYLSSREINDRKSGKQASCFFYSYRGSSYKYTSQPSRYTGEIGTDASGVGPAKLLRPGTDPRVKDELMESIKTAEETIVRIKPEIDVAHAEIVKLTANGQEAQMMLKNAKRTKQDYYQFMSKLKNQRDKLAEAEENASKDNTREKNKMIVKIQKLLDCSITMTENAAKAHNECMKTTHSLTGVKMTEDGLSDRLIKLFNLLKEKRMETADLSNEYNRVDSEYNHRKENLKDLLKVAEKLAPKEEWHERLQQDDLPSTLEEVENDIDEAEIRVNSITDNPHAIREYERRKVEIEEYRSKLQGLADDKLQKVSVMDQKFKAWESKLVNIVQQVNGKFCSYMKEVGCAGEIRLYTGFDDSRGNDENGKVHYNFKNWGIEILVKFREASNLQILSAQTHSGGERSVSTIMYLMGLQHLMSSPFRCVDEINQGLDERNERLVFKRIVENSTIAPTKEPDEHSGQYFLITPKLLPNLEGMENEDITVLFVFSGPHNFGNCLDWNINKFIDEKRKFYNQETNEKKKRRRS